MVGPSLAEQLQPWMGSAPVYTAVAAGVRGLVLDGRLPVGARVPSERDLAGTLGISRTTVSAAYDVLRAQGYLRSDRGAGSRTALPAVAPARPDTDPGQREDLLDLTVAAPPAPAVLLDAVREAADALAPLIAGHGLHPLGLPELRASVAGHLSARGLPTAAEQVLITNGSMHAFDLLLRALTRPGDRVLVEQPGYPGVLDAVAAHRLRALALPVTADGWSPVRPSAPVRLVHVTPDGQNPTGLLADDDQRSALLRSVGDALVVCDEAFADVVLDGSTPTPLAALDRRVVTVGSMSKAFWAGLRIGWVRADPELVARLAQSRAGQDLASPVLEQLVAVRLLRHAGQVLPARREQLRTSRDTVLAAIAAALPTWRCLPPRAGAALWVELPRPGATRLAAAALDQGLRLVPGPRFTLDGTADRFFRLPLGLPPDRVDDIVARLARAASRVADGVPAGGGAPRWTA